MGKRRKTADGATVTVDEVARLSGVSVATVSRTLNSPERVRADTRKRVEAAVRATGYRPNFAARALASNRTRTVGAIIPTLNNAIFAEGVNAFEQGLRERGYTLLVSVSNYDQEAEFTNLSRMVERSVDALLLVGTDHDGETLSMLRRANIPFVCTWSFAPDRGLPTVGFDNAKAMDAVVDHLVGLGHSRVAMLAGLTAQNDRARDRVSGVKAGLLRHGIALSPADVVEVPYSVDDAMAAARTMLGAERRPSAIVCGNDVIAYGVLFAAAGLGIAVPGELSLVGFDNLELSAQMPPGLTTVNVPATRMGETAAERLVDMVEQRGAVPDTPCLELPTRLVLRGTTAPPAGPRPKKRTAKRTKRA